MKSNHRLRKIGIRLCLTCGDNATYMLCYQVGDKEQKAELVEHYCDKHVGNRCKNWALQNFH